MKMFKIEKVLMKRVDKSAFCCLVSLYVDILNMYCLLSQGIKKQQITSP